DFHGVSPWFPARPSSHSPPCSTRPPPYAPRADGGHFWRYSHTKPVLSSRMNAERRPETLLYSSAAFFRDFASRAESEDASAAFKSFSQAAYFFLDSASLTPWAGETRTTWSPTRRSSLPSPLTSATQTRVARVGPARSPSRPRTVPAGPQVSTGVTR